MLAKTFLLGHLGRDPETKKVPGRVGGSERSLCTFSLATSAGYGDRKTTTWWNVVCFGALADTCAKYLAKGRLVLVEGEASTRSWKGKDGEEKSRLEVTASSVKFLDKSGSKEEEQGGENDPF